MAEETAAAEPTFETVDYDKLDAESWDAETAKRWREKMAAEHKKYRERFAPFEKALSAYSDEDRRILLEVLETYPKDPASVLAFWVENAKTMYGDEFLKRFIPTEEKQVMPEQQQQQEKQETQQQSLSGITVDDIMQVVQKAVASELQKIETRQQIVRELTELGVDPSSDDAEVLCFVAAKKFDGDVKKAYSHMLERLSPQQQTTGSEGTAAESEQTKPPAPVAGTAGQNPVQDLSRNERINAIADRVFGSS